MNAIQKAALLKVMHGVIDAVKAGGSTGGPSGIIYASMMAQGATFNQFQSIMSIMVNRGLVSLDDNDCYHVSQDCDIRLEVLKNTVSA